MSRRDVPDESLSEDDALFTESETELLDSSGGSEEQTDVDDEDAEQIDAEQPVSKRRKSAGKKRTRKGKRNRFVEMEAEVGDDDDDDEEDDDDDGGGREEDGFSSEEDDDEDDGFVDNEIEEREKGFSAAFERRLAAHAAKRDAARKAFEEELEPEEVERRLKQLYGRSKPVSAQDMRASSATMATVLQPQPSDPKLWLVKCRPGKERAAVAALLRGLSMFSEGVSVFSVVGSDSLKGFIYIEAHKANDVMNAVQKAKVKHLVFASPINRPVLVPLSEMTDVLAASAGSVKQKTDIRSINLGTWVRVKRGKYTGDLAQVIEVDQETNGEANFTVVRVKLLPRLVYRSSASSGRKERPSARPFDPQEAAQYGSVTKSRGYWLFNGEAYKDGFLFKDVRASSLLIENVSPRIDELERFGSLSIGDDATDQLDEVSVKLSKGEAVLVTRGEFQHLTGIVDSNPGDDQMVSVLFDDRTAFSEPLPINSKFLTRLLHLGDSVKVTAGEHAGKMGLIVAMSGGEQKQVTIYSSLNDEQFTVSVSLITDASASEPIETGKPRRAEGPALEIHDLVSIEGEGEAGVVLRIMCDDKHASVLDINGQVQQIPMKALRKIPKPALAGAARFDPTVFKTGDRVQFSDGEQGSRPATVLQTFRTSAFLRTIDTNQVLARPLSLLSRPEAFPGLASEQQGRSPARAAPMRHLIGKSITISGAGPYKGYVGIVKDLSETTARVELHTDSRVVTISRDRIVVPGATTDSTHRHPAWGVSEGSAWSSSKTPAWGNSGAKTPAWGNAGGKTPAWGNSGGKTPAWGNAGGKTPAWGNAGGKTPAWGNTGGKTPAWGSSSSKTPAWGSSSSKTPAWGSSSSKTPGLQNVGDGGKTPAWQAVSVGKSATPQKQAPASLPPIPSLPSWIIPDAEASLKSGSGVVRVISTLPSGLVQVSGKSEPVPHADLVPVVPAKKDAVKLLNEDRATGTVIGLDGPDAVIRVDGTADFRIVPISSLVKIARTHP